MIKKILIIAILGIIIPSISFGAIAFDAAVGKPNTTTNSGTPLTWNHTVTGSNTILFASVFSTIGSDNVSGATYNGVAMTLVGKATQSNYYNYLFYLINPATGTHQVSVSFISGSNDESGGVSASYTGAKQSGQPDAYHSATLLNGISITDSVTSVAANSWFVSSGFKVNQAADITAGTGLTKRAGSLTNGISDALGIGDSNSAQPAGAYSMTWNFATSDSRIMMISASFAPVAEAPSAPTMQVIWF